MGPTIIRICVFAILSISFVHAAIADDYAGAESFAFSDLSFSKVAGFDAIELKDGGSLAVAGSPALPYRQVNVALPHDAVVTAVTVLHAACDEVGGIFDVVPCSRPRQVRNPVQGEPFVRDRSVYDKDAFFPAKWCERGAAWSLAGQRFVSFKLFPVRYNPVTGRLIAASSISYRVDYTVGNALERQTFNFSPRSRDHYLNRLKQMAANPEDVAVPAWTGSGSRALPPDEIDHVVITTTAFENEFDDLVSLHTKTGLRSTVVTVDWIYANYSGGDSQEQIRNFVADAHATWGTIYFLIGGDTAQVPCRITHIYGQDVPNDTYYADYNNDWAVDVYVGRASVESTQAIANFVNKTVGYMVDPPANFGDTVLLLGFDLDSSTPGEDMMNVIENNWVPSWAWVSYEYDSEPGTHVNDSRAYINNGKNVIAHCDHCGSDVIGIGNYNHGGVFTLFDARHFMNGSRVGLFYTLGCWPGAYDYDDCWGEAFVQNTGGGGIAFVGNSRYGYYCVGSHNYYSSKYEKRFFKCFWSQGATRAGEALGASKNDFYPGDDLYRYCFTELNLFGDPALSLWTASPVDLSCAHTLAIEPGPQDYVVNVKWGGNNCWGATVCVWKGDQVYEVGETNFAGNVTFAIDPLDAGTMFVTASVLNGKTYLGECLVQTGVSPVPDVKIDGQDTHLSVPSTQAVSVTLSLDPGSQGTKDFDWWVLAEMNSTYTFWWEYPDTWTYSTSAIRAWAGPLFPVTDYDLANRTLPVGDYTFTFAVDIRNGMLEGTYSDSITLNVY